MPIILHSLYARFLFELLFDSIFSYLRDLDELHTDGGHKSRLTLLIIDAVHRDVSTLKALLQHN